MEISQTGGIRFLAFARLCFNEALRTSADKADWIVLLVGSALGPIALLVPRWETTVTHLLVVAPMSALATVVIFRIFLSPLLVYRNRDAEAHKAQNELRTVIASCEEQIRQGNETIRVLSEKSKRSPAEQHDFNNTKKALEMSKELGILALRHIRAQRSLSFGAPGSSYMPALPPGLTIDRALWVYRHCAAEGILNGTTRNNVETFTVPDRMDKILDEALFDDESGAT